MSTCGRCGQPIGLWDKHDWMAAHKDPTYCAAALLLAVLKELRSTAEHTADDNLEKPGD